jgi:arylamine N-acetyltransferase
MSRTDRLYKRYCRLLGVAPARPDAALLRRLVRAQLMRAPFENISKLYGIKRLGLRELPALDRYLDEMERFGFGGTCYPNNIHFWGLLRHLGFDATLCGADMSSGPDVHVVIVCFGHERYVLRPQDGNGRSGVDHYREGELIHGYLAKPTPRAPSYFDEIVGASYADTAMFMNALRLIRFLDGRSVSITNGSFIERTVDEIHIARLPSMNAVVEAVEREFGMPGEIVRQATEGMELAGLRRVDG